MISQTLNDDVIYYIQEFLETSAELCAFRSLSKEMKSIFDRRGYCRNISVGLNTPLCRMLDMYIIHHRLLEEIKFMQVIDPLTYFSWKWASEMTFIGCYLPNEISPPLSLDTKVIRIVLNSQKLKIDLSKFPNLETLEIDAVDVDLTSIGKCTKLKHVNIHVRNRNKRFVDLKYLKINNK